MYTYKSSSGTFFYKYIFIPVWCGGFFFAIIFTWGSSEPFLHNWSRVAALMVGWALIWLVPLMIRLKTVEATEEYLIIKNGSGQKLISYKDIEYVMQVAMINPILISIKYHDYETGEPNKILIIPPKSSKILRLNIFSGEVEMTKFIREQITKANPGYDPNSEPSRWLIFALFFLTGLPVGLIAKTFFLPSLQ